MSLSKGVTPTGSGCQPTASAAEEASSQSGIPNALGVTAFICAIRDRFMRRAGLAPENAVESALAALEWWEDCGEPVEMTTECANEIADTEMEHWDAD